MTQKELLIINQVQLLKARLDELSKLFAELFQMIVIQDHSKVEKEIESSLRNEDIKSKNMADVK